MSAEPTSDLAPSIFLPKLCTRRLGRVYKFLPVCASTNDEVQVMARQGANEGLVFAADAQTAGRGRRGRTWHSPPGENLYFSLLLRPQIPTHAATTLPLVAGVALGKALCALGYNAHLKWPNDVLLETGEGMRKVAGILAEMASEGQQVRSIVLGLGINVTSTNFPPDLRSRATSLRLASGCTLDRGDLLAAFLNAFEPLFDGLVAHGPADGLSQWRRFACLGQSCWVERGSLRIKGIAEDVDASGALVLRIASGEQISIHAGEVNWLPSV